MMVLDKEDGRWRAGGWVVVPEPSTPWLPRPLPPSLPRRGARERAGGDPSAHLPGPGPGLGAGVRAGLGGGKVKGAASPREGRAEPCDAPRGREEAPVACDVRTPWRFA